MALRLDTARATRFSPRFDDPFSPSFPNPTLQAVAWHDGTLWVGGDFRVLDGAPQRGLAAFRPKPRRPMG